MGRPRFGGGVVDVDVGRVGLVGVQEVNGVIELLKFVWSD